METTTATDLIIKGKSHLSHDGAATLCGVEDGVKGQRYDRRGWCKACEKAHWHRHRAAILGEYA